jgi:intracellular septation protein
MQSFIIDFIPVLLFLLAFKMYGIYVATTVGIVATAIQVVITRIIRHRFDKQQLVTLVVFAVFGGMTLYFHNPAFVKWKPTIVFWIFGIAFIISQFIGKKPIIQAMLEKVVDAEMKSPVPTQVWRRLNLAWGIFFLVLGTINIYVAHYFSIDTWVNFKVFGILGLIMIFSFIQAFYLARYLSDTK